MTIELTPLQERRALGAYYTPSATAEWMVDWAVREPGLDVLEPSSGDGVFLKALRASALPTRITAVEIDGAVFDSSPSLHDLGDGVAINDDFLNVSPRPMDVAIGNPPYVRLNTLNAEQKQRALDASTRVLGASMEPSGSLWMPFVLHAMSFLRQDGRMAWVLPYEATHVRYARPFWTALAANFASVRVIRSRKRIFDDILQDVVILLADGKGGVTDTVEFEAYRSVGDLVESLPMVRESLPIAAIVAGSREFERALLPSATRALLAELEATAVPLREAMRLRIGYVSGSKTFFHPSPQAVDKFGLSAAELRPALSSGRQLRAAGLHTSTADAGVSLFSPGSSSRPQRGEPAAEYIAHGESEGVDRGYKTRNRDPWYSVPGVEIADVLFPVFSDTPRLWLNDQGMVASNSFVCGFLDPSWSPAELATAWYTPFTRLQVELNVHSLGGGVLVMIPGELGKVLIRRPGGSPDSTALAELDRRLASGELESAYLAASPAHDAHDDAADAADRLLAEAVEILREWRRN